MKTATGRFILIAAALTFIAACTALAWHLRERTAVFYTDADAIRQPAGAEAPRDVLWKPAQAVSEPVRTPLDEYEPSVSVDGVFLYFVRGRPGENADLYVATRTPEGWGEPEPIAAINSLADELGPEPSADGKRLYFYSDRGGGAGGYDLWYSERAEGTWQEPVNLGPAINTVLNEYAPAVSPDGRWLYFSSNRPRGDLADDPDAWRVLLDQNLDSRHYELYRAELTTDGPRNLTALDDLNSPANDGAPAVSPGGDFLYFCSNRTGGRGGFDLYRARRLEDGHGPLEHLGEAVNSTADEMDPAPDLAGFGLNFSSNRETIGIPGQRATYDLYHTTSREVFRDLQHYREDVAWSKILPLIPWVLFVPLMLLLLWLMRRFTRGEKWSKLSLIARCLIASVMAHGILVVLLAFWGVSASVADWIDEGKSMRIALVTSRGGDDLAAQIRGSLTETAIETPTMSAARAESAAEPMETAAATAVMAVQRAPMDAETMKPTSEATTEASVAPPETQVADAQPAPAALAAVDLPEAAAPSRQAEARETTDASIEAPAPKAAEVDPIAVASATFVEVAPETSPQWAEAIGAERLVTPAEATEAVPASAAASVPTADTVPDDRPQPSLPSLAEAEQSTQEEAQATVQAGAGKLERTDTPVTYTSRAMMVESSATSSRQTLAEPPSRIASSSAVEAEAPVNPDEATAAAVTLSAPALPTVKIAQGAPVQSEAGNAEATPSAVVAASPGSTSRAEVTTTNTTTNPAARTERNPTTSTIADDTTFEATIAEAQPQTISTPALPDAVAGAFAAGRTIDVRVPTTADRTDEPADATVAVEVATPAGTTARRAVAATSTEFERDLPRVETDTPASSMPEMTKLGDPSATRDDAELAYTSSPDEDTVADRVMLALPTVLTPELPTMREATPEPEPKPEPEPMLAQNADTPFAQREEKNREQILEKMGGSAATERAVVTALDWLARHQSPDGRWDSERYDDQCGRCDGPATVEVNIATTGLSVLAFLGANHTHRNDSQYRENVLKALAWLLEQQEHNGALIGGESMYSHGIATIALAEAYGMTGDEELREPVERAVKLIIAARNRRTGGWRYLPGQVGDTSVLGWQIMALVAARKAGIDVPEVGLDEGRRWLASVASRKYPGRFGYQPRHGETPAMTAESMFVHQLLGTDPAEAQAPASAVYLLEHRPDWDRDANTYYWYYGTMALFQFQGPAWTRWNRRVSSELLAHQVQAGSAAGSWPPNDQWSNVGGRIYQTAICTLTLEVYYRYLPGFISAPEE